MKAPYGPTLLLKIAASVPRTKAGAFARFLSRRWSHCAKPATKACCPLAPSCPWKDKLHAECFIVCSGKVTLSTTSREGKILILKTAGPGRRWG
jgi:hypothetical protein